MTALGDLSRVLKRLRQVSKQRLHFRRGLEILLSSEILTAPFIAQHFAARDTYARFMRLEVVRCHELNRVRRHHR